MTTQTVPLNEAAAPVLSVRDLSVAFPRHGAPSTTVVDGVSLTLHPGQVMVVLGESGSGKTVLSRSISGMAAADALLSGRVDFGGDNVLTMPRPRLRRLLGSRIATVFQDPTSSLDPMRRVGGQLGETLRRHQRGLSRAEARVRATALLEAVEIRDVGRVLRSYPHELSGGMRQRIAIAIAICCDPELLIADEPSSALDASVGARVVELLDRLRSTLGMAILFITHDISVAADITRGDHDAVTVMLGGQVVEQGPAAAVLGEPQHPYTRALLTAQPSEHIARGRLAVVPDEVRTRRDWGPLVETAPGHLVALAPSGHEQGTRT